MMAKRIVTEPVEVVACDWCGARGCYDSHKCKLCGKDCCYECANAGRVVQYNAGVHFSGHGDAAWCVGCDREDGSALHRAYVAIKSLRDEARGWSDDFEKRRKSAEALVEKIRERPTP